VDPQDRPAPAQRPPGRLHEFGAH